MSKFEIKNGLSYGLFTQPSFITIGDTYDKKGQIDERARGKQLLTNPTKKGKTPNVYFDKSFTYKADQYMDPGTLERKHRKEQKAKNISNAVFRPSSPSKKNSGLGNYYGCIGSKYEHKNEYGKESTKTPQPQPRNMFTSPAKKGTYGVPGTTIGSSFNYKSDPYDAARQKALEEKKKNAEKMPATPFKSMTKKLDFFDSYPNVAASRVYTADEKAAELRAKAANQSKSEEQERVPAPFRPSSPAKHGYFNGTFNKFPEYVDDPYEEREKKAREERNRNKPPVVFRPVSNSKSTFTRSIIFGKIAL